MVKNNFSKPKYHPKLKILRPIYFLKNSTHRFEGHIIKSGTPEQGTVEHRTPVEQRNTGGTIEIPRNSKTGEHQLNNGTKQHEEMLPIQNSDILSR